jgi:hypothetical protein
MLPLTPNLIGSAKLNGVAPEVGCAIYWRSSPIIRSTGTTSCPGIVPRRSTPARKTLRFPPV